MAEIIVDILFRMFFKKNLLTMYRLSGGLFRWIINFGQISYQEILNKNYNGRLGFVIWLTIFIFIFLLNLNI